jgi:hypothetical protein
MPVIPATREADVEGSRPKIDPDKSSLHYLKNKLRKQKDWRLV